jgi:hypothetical protein
VELLLPLVANRFFSVNYQSNLTSDSLTNKIVCHEKDAFEPPPDLCCKSGFCQPFRE